MSQLPENDLEQRLRDLAAKARQAKLTGRKPWLKIAAGTLATAAAVTAIYFLTSHNHNSDTQSPTAHIGASQKNSASYKQPDSATVEKTLDKDELWNSFKKKLQSDPTAPDVMDLQSRLVTELDGQYTQYQGNYQTIIKAPITAEQDKLLVELENRVKVLIGRYSELKAPSDKLANAGSLKAEIGKSRLAYSLEQERIAKAKTRYTSDYSAALTEFQRGKIEDAKRMIDDLIKSLSDDKTPGLEKIASEAGDLSVKINTRYQQLEQDYGKYESIYQSIKSLVGTGQFKSASDKMPELDGLKKLDYPKAKQLKLDSDSYKSKVIDKALKSVADIDKMNADIPATIAKTAKEVVVINFWATMPAQYVNAGKQYEAAEMAKVHGKYDEAIAGYQAAIAVWPQDWEYTKTVGFCHYGIAVSLMAKKDYVAAINEFKATGQFFEKDSGRLDMLKKMTRSLYLLQGNDRFMKGNFSEAADFYEKANAMGSPIAASLVETCKIVIGAK